MQKNKSQATFQQIMDRVSSDKKVFFCSDFHLTSTPVQTEEDKNREINIVNWLTSIENEAGAIVMVGDIFDVWFEYRYLIPKGFSHFFVKLYELRKKKVEIIFFSGNHDYFMYDYFLKTYGIPVFKTLESFTLFEKTIIVGHGDGLGPNDLLYKALKRLWGMFFFKTLVLWFPSQLSMFLVQKFLKKRRKKPVVIPFIYEKEWIIQWIKESYVTSPHDIYIFGHRHLPIHLDDVDGFKYINLGEWINWCTFAEISKSSVKYMYWNKEAQSSQPFQGYPLNPQPLDTAKTANTVNST